jgi:FAD/FMN-containing dehydrogenase
MRRRDVLAMAAVVPFSSAPGSAAISSKAMRRVRPADPNWPPPQAWDALKARVGGNLIRPAALLAPCDPDAKSAECHALLKALQNPFFVGDQPSGTQVSGYLDAWAPAPSAYAVVAHSAADVAAAVTFARSHNLRLVVKGGGHSYQGTSNAPDSLLIWTRPMRDVTVLDAFTPMGAPSAHEPVPAVTAGAGALWIDLYDAVTTRAGRYVQGGGCTTVGVAGHIQSGGFGSHSKGFGTSSAHLLEAEVVTADGRIRTINAYRDPDLFWAIKGGGGGSLAVITRVTLRTHELPARFGGANGSIKAASPEAYRRLLSRFLEFYAAALLSPRWGEQVEIRPDNVLKISMVSQGLDNSQSVATWRPFVDWVFAAPSDYRFTEALEAGTAPARGAWDVAARRQRGSKAMNYDDRPDAPAAHGWWAGDQGQVSAFLHGYDSVWLPAELLKPASRETLADSLFKASRSLPVSLHFNKGLAGAPSEALAAARDTAMNPDALGAFALAIVATGGLPAYMELIGLKPDLAAARKNAAWVAASAAALREVAPTGGSYLSESSFFNADWRRAYWGSNYPKLRGVKAKYDPEGLFFVHHGVGCEAWSADGFERLT